MGRCWMDKFYIPVVEPSRFLISLGVVKSNSSTNFSSLEIGMLELRCQSESVKRKTCT